jgi:hypothetical protein
LFDYNERYGRGSYMEAILGQIQRGSRNTALMQTWGPSPRAAYDTHVQIASQRAKSRGDVDAENLLLPTDDGFEQTSFRYWRANAFNAAIHGALYKLLL